MRSPINIQCQPTPLMWVGGVSGDVAPALADEDGNILMGESGEVLVRNTDRGLPAPPSIPSLADEDENTLQDEDENNLSPD